MIVLAARRTPRFPPEYWWHSGCTDLLMTRTPLTRLWRLSVLSQLGLLSACSGSVTAEAPGEQDDEPADPGALVPVVSDNGSIACREIILTAKIMDAIFEQIGGCQPVLAEKAALGGS